MVTWAKRPVVTGTGAARQRAGGAGSDISPRGASKRPFVSAVSAIAIALALAGCAGGPRPCPDAAGPSPVGDVGESLAGEDGVLGLVGLGFLVGALATEGRPCRPAAPPPSPAPAPAPR